jgi:hypothetical protein
MLPLMAVGALAQLPSILGGIITGAKQKKLSKKINPMDPTATVTDAAQEQLQSSRNAYQGRMAGAQQAEQNLASGEANQFANVNRNAGDATQALALAAGVGGQTDQSLVNLSVAEGQNKQALQGNYDAALQNMSAEERRVYEDKLRKYLEALKSKQDLMRSGMINQQNAFNQIGNIGSLAASGMFGGGGGGTYGG